MNWNIPYLALAILGILVGAIGARSVAADGLLPIAWCLAFSACWAGIAAIQIIRIRRSASTEAAR
jgi:hypothetical protein